MPTAQKHQNPCFYSLRLLSRSHEVRCSDLADAAAWPTAEHGVGGVTIFRNLIDPETGQVEVRIPAAGQPVMFGRVGLTIP
jgi:hypothetical protein